MGRSEKAAVEAARSQNLSAMTGFENQITGELSKIPSDLTPEQKSAIRRARLGGTDIGYQLAEDEATRRYTSTGSTAAYPELLSELALQRTREKAQGGAELESQFAQEPINRALMRAGLLQPLYQTRAGLYGQTIPGAGSGQSGSLAGSLIGGGAQIGAAVIPALIA